MRALACSACSAVDRRSSMDVIHFPRRSASVALETAGARARQLRRRASRTPEDSRSAAPRRRRARRHVGGDDVRSASAAHRSPRQGAAAADDQGAEARGDRRRRRAGRGHRAVHRANCRCGIRKRSCAPRWSTGCTCRKCGSARIFCSATIAPATSRCCGRSARARLQGREDRSGPLQGLRRQQHADPPADQRSAGGRGGRAARPSVLHRRHGRRGRPARPDDRISNRQSAHRQRAAAAERRVCDDRSPSTAWCCRRSPISASARPSTTRDGRRSRRTSSTSTAISTARRFASGSCSACATSGRSTRWRRCGADRRRLRPGARALRSAFTVRSRPRAGSPVLLRARILQPGSAGVARRGSRGQRVSSCRRRAGTCRSLTTRWPRPPQPPPPARAAATSSSARRTARSRSSCPSTADRSGRPLIPYRGSIVTLRLYNTLTRTEEAFAPGPGQHGADVHLRPHGVRARPHRQLPDVRLRRRAAAHAEVSARLSGQAGDELHRRRRPHDPRRAEGRHGSPLLHRSVRRRVSRGCARAGPRRRRGEPARHRPGQHPGDGRPDRRARSQRPHLSQRWLGVLQDLDPAQLRQAGPPRSRRHEAGRARRHRHVRERRCPRFRVVEGDQAG